MLQKSRNGAKSVLVVLDGYKVSKEKNGGHAPLLWALHDGGLVEKDEVVVLAVFNLHEQTTSPDTGSVCCLLRENKTCHSPAVDHLKLLQEEIISKMEKLTDIFKSFHEACKTNDVKFMLKIAADYQPKSIIINEANCAGAKWIVMDRCFADDNGFQLNEIECITLVSLVLVSDSEQLVLHNCPPPKPKLTEDPHIYRTLPHLVFDNQPFKSSSDQASTSTQAENLIREETEICPSRVLVGATSREIAKVNNALGFSLQLSSWEAILEITSDFKDINGRDQNENFQMFRGHIPIYESEALVKTFSSNLGSILDAAEKMIAVSMHHKNILRLLGYHQTANAISLAFPFPAKGTLERFLHATKNPMYLNYIQQNGLTLGADEGDNTFGWDNKHVGARILLSKAFLVQKVQSLHDYKGQSDNFICSLIPQSQYTPGGLLFKMDDSNMQYVTSTSFLLVTYAKYLTTSQKVVNCGGSIVTPRKLRTLAKQQVDYLLGDNPLKMSYMVGYGPRYPQRIHHRGSSLPSIASHPSKIQCTAGFSVMKSQSPNPNILIGVVVARLPLGNWGGGPFCLTVEHEKKVQQQMLQVQEGRRRYDISDTHSKVAS
ncbi:Protein kinase domain-containing protein [Heracleum sosnowskyi]|uniref:Endoglucanase n=1 Tax=Heracleum sosnowskyi TaxID=360622 RepID=A0AAD8N7K9_9APIA|nr:Protein kinase domain-containing protein [Heracleum sosnowskyi]